MTKKTKEGTVKVQDKKSQTPRPVSESIFGEHSGIFAPFQSLRSEVDDLFNQFTHRFGAVGRAEFPEFKVPVTDVDETDEAFEISAELPGIDQKDIDVTIENSTVTIHGEREQSKQSGDAKHRVSECSYGVYERSLSLPFPVDAKKVEAEYGNGVLHLTIPKPKEMETKPQKIDIKKAA